MADSGTSSGGTQGALQLSPLLQAQGAPTSGNLTSAPGTLVIGTQSAPATPLETGPDGRPLTWAGATDAASLGTVVNWAVAQYNYAHDAQRMTFTNPFPSAFVPLAQDAFNEWASLANIKPVQVGDVAQFPPQEPDIRIGLSTLASPGSPMVGTSFLQYAATDKFGPDNLVAVEDPNQMPVVALSNGDFQYEGYETTVFQSLLQQTGHALGLAANPDDPHSIMYPTLTSLNRLPDIEDVRAIQALYGPPATG